MANVHQITNDMTKDAKTEDITQVQYKILEYITVSQSVTITEISDCLHVSLPNTSRELRKLIEKNLCKKVSDESDRRKYYIQLTEKGNALMEEAFRKIQLQFDERIKHLTDEELQEINKAVEVLQQKIFS
ncbi:MarR family winged helix-turn-helix transcriptional regulator [Robertmurraya korlensis]|uniref:MarR family winged helix-turn-helix transcriptional regulator n=1 Tax=Robertmurraya korlensis TaxID=519977 RepID=UPI0027BA0E4F|nr:MarR family transcriptional regulator [Robertmurraya korlensis]